MKKILCYGDSNTYGFNPLDGSRYDVRWTTILQKNLGAEYEVIEEGGCDRTGFVSNPKGILFSAQEHFPTVLSENVDILILAIGTNDLQFQYDINDEFWKRIFWTDISDVNLMRQVLQNPKISVKFIKNLPWNLIVKYLISMNLPNHQILTAYTMTSLHMN